VTRVIGCQWLSGCNQSYRRVVFRDFVFDENVKRYSFGEDVDFSYRIYKTSPGSLLMTPNARLTHRMTLASRAPSYNLTCLRSIYQNYFFFKDVGRTTTTGLLFEWSRTGILLGSLLIDLAGLTRSGIKRSTHFINQAKAYIVCMKHREQIRIGDLSFAEVFLKY
jgi:GT2 family glycosyltransferase